MLRRNKVLWENRGENSHLSRGVSMASCRSCHLSWAGRMSSLGERGLVVMGQRPGPVGVRKAWDVNNNLLTRLR